ncbi:unnamed protein product [Closterium sp. NIES-53]
MIKGFQQREGIDFQKVFAPVSKAPTLWLLLAAAAVCGWKVEQMDVKTAFLYGVVDEEIYMKQPEGYDDGSGRVFRLNKAIYGLKQAPMSWGGGEGILLVYVDDILLSSPSLERIKEVQGKLKETFQCKALGPVGYYLGLHVERDEVKGWLRLHQHKYLAAMGEKYGLEEGRSVKTPLPSGFQLHLNEEEGEVLEYELQRRFQSMVGSLMYASVNTRPDIAFSVSQLARVVSRPLQEHLDAAERLVRLQSATGGRLLPDLLLQASVSDRVLLHVAAQRDYELHSLDFGTAFLRGSLHEEIWLRRPPGFTGSFCAGTQSSLWRPVYDLRKVPREWHDALRTTIAAPGFAPSTADASLFLRTDPTVPPFYILVYADDLVFATADTEALALVKVELQMRHICTDLGELRSYLGLQITRDRARCTTTLTQSHMVHQVLQHFRSRFSSPQPTLLATGHSLSATPSDESVKPSGPYLELVGCLMYQMTCTRPDLAYPLSILARFVAPGVSLEGALDSCAEGTALLVQYIGHGACAWRTGSSVLYVDNKAMIALCEEQRLEHRMKHIALRYFLARELQQRGQLRLAYVASRVNTSDVFTKALGSGDH